uniref:AsIV-cont00103-ORF1 n=1 Tax=Apophua simplicipes ichnovirus TaxID=1329648 RepID=S5DYY8_9VIRU|nr:AsIV-cont00103-ORF1 [Apophua simplicipes ichnovirus]
MANERYLGSNELTQVFKLILALDKCNDHLRENENRTVLGPSQRSKLAKTRQRKEMLIAELKSVVKYFPAVPQCVLQQIFSI